MANLIIRIQFDRKEIFFENNFREGRISNIILCMRFRILIPGDEIISPCEYPDYHGMVIIFVASKVYSVSHTSNEASEKLAPSTGLFLMKNFGSQENFTFLSIFLVLCFAITVLRKRSVPNKKGEKQSQSPCIMERLKNMTKKNSKWLWE